MITTNLFNGGLNSDSGFDHIRTVFILYYAIYS